MSSCTAAEIAEKKRLALEKLKAKKAGPNNLSNLDNNTKLKAPINALPQPVHKITTSFYKQPTVKTSENKASAFINALKESSVFSHRHDLRSSVHPYQRPQGKNETEERSAVLKKPILGLTPPAPLASVFNKTITCSVYLVSATRFAVKSSGFHEQLVNVFKTIPTKCYDNNTRLWTFDLKDYQLLQNAAAGLKPDVVLGVIPKKVINLCLAPPKELDYSCLASIEPTLAEKLMPFQQEGVCFAIAHHGRIMICDEMGLGKTYQALAVADFYKEDWPLLICTTASTRESWANHVRVLLPTIPMHYTQVLTNNQHYFGDVKVLITSYNMIEKVYTKLKERKFGFIIFDESHMLKNNKAKCTVIADRLAMQAKHIILLSGTPALSRPLELFTQLQMVDRKFMSFMEFTTRYCDGKQSNFGWDATGQSNLQELNIVLKVKYMIRRTKADVLPDLAAKYRETVVLDPALVWPSDDAKATLDAVAKNLIASKGREREEILLRFYAQTAEVKTRAVCVYIKSLLKENKKFLVFAHHRVMMDAITDCLVKSNVKFVRIDGSTKNEARGEYINTFQHSSSCKVAILSLKACNSGITLTAAELIIFAELDWNPSTLAQAESRAHRIGQEKSVTCRYLMAKKTADDVIWNMLKNKQDTLNRAGLFCEDLQDATKATAQTTSYKINNYFSPNKSIKSDGSPNNSKGALNDSFDHIKPTNSYSPKISTFFTPVKKTNKEDSLTEMETDSIYKPSCSNKINNNNNNKECDIFSDFFNNDDDDDAIACMRSQAPVTKTNTIAKSRLVNINEDLFDDTFDDIDLTSVRTQIVYQQKGSSTINVSGNNKKIANIDAFFDEDDDDTFKDLKF